MDVGGALRDAREQRGISLDQLSHATKIRVATLDAIETNRREKLPEAIFVRGFVRAYAREVGLNPEDTVRRYLGQFEPAISIIEVAKPGTEEVRAERGPAVRGEIDQDQAERRTTPFQRLLAAVVLIMGVVGYYTVAWWRASAPPATLSLSRPPASSETARSSSPAARSTAARPTRAETATAGSGAPTPAVASEADRLHLEIHSRGFCWLSATVDGARVVYRLMQPGDHQTIDVHDEAVLRVGNPAAFAFSINGREGRSLGAGDEPVTVHITPQNYRDFLRRSPSP
jgi:cytoskeleton protein RodZ